jgi:glycine betaine/choline ABC-type transport system substrate-binding protein
MWCCRLALVLTALVIAGCGGPPAPPSVTIAAAPDAESTLLAHLYGAALRYYGSATVVTPTPEAMQKLDAGDVGVVPGFTGRLLEVFQPDTTARAGAQVYRDMVSVLPEGVAAGDYAMSAEDKPAVVVTEATARAWGGRDVTAAARNCAQVTPGMVAGARAPSTLGVCRLPRAREFPDSATLFAALKSGQVNAAWTTTAAPDIPSELLVLADRTALIRAENVVPLYRRNELNESQVLAVNEIAGVLDTAALAEMRRKVADGADPGQVAADWLVANPLGR